MAALPAVAETLGALLETAPHQPAIVAGDRQVSRAELREAAERAARGLAGLGLRRGDVIALWLPDGLAWLQTLFAAARLGVLVVPVSTRYRDSELRHVLEVSKARLLVTVERFLDFDYANLARTLQPALPELKRIVCIPQPGDFFAYGADSDAPPESVTLADPAASANPTSSADPAEAAEPDDACCTFSTSGTTGHPKLAVHSQAALARHARAAAAHFDFRAGDRLLCALPFNGTYGLMSMLAALAAGARCVFLPIFDTRAAAGLMARHGITHVFGSDSMFEPILDLPEARLASWRVGGIADFVGNSARVVARAEREWGTRLIGLYGSSECLALLSGRRLEADSAERAVPGGHPVSPAIGIRVVDPQDQRELAIGEAGELQIRGYNVCSGYLNDPQATQRAFTPDGWFRTGDLCLREADGFIYRSRLNDSLRLRGYLVDPSEIEACLLSLPGVRGAQVVGVRRAAEGDIAVAFVIADPDGRDEARLIAQCREHIAAYKAPRHVVFVDTFPSVSGPNGVKIQKNRLREQAVAQFGS